MGGVETIVGKFHFVGAPASFANMQALLDEVEKTEKVQGPAIPGFLEAIWSVGAEWHFIEHHYNSFGLNIFPPTRELGSKSVEIFGDEEGRQEWAKDLGGDLSAAGGARGRGGRL